MTEDDGIEELARWFSRVLERPCRAFEGQAVDFRPRSRSVLFCFVNSLGGVQSIWICDHVLAVSWAAALDNRDLERVRVQSRMESLSDDCSRLLIDFWNQVVMPTSLTREGLVFGRLHQDPNAPLSPDMDAVLTRPPRRLDCRLSIEGIGEGRLSILTS